MRTVKLFMKFISKRYIYAIEFKTVNLFLESVAVEYIFTFLQIHVSITSTVIVIFLETNREELLFA